MTIADRDVVAWSKNDRERRFVGVESMYDGRRCIYGDVGDGHDNGANARDKTAFSAVTFLDLEESKARVLASELGRQFLEAFEWVIGDLQVEEGEVHTIRINNAVIGEILQALDIGRGSSRSFLPS